MNAAQMQAAGAVLLGLGVVFFTVSQVILNRWHRSYDAEISRM